MNKIILQKPKDDINYVRFGTCHNCGAKIALKGQLMEIEDFESIRCPYCDQSYAVLLGFPHKSNSWFAKWHIEKIKENQR